jgi:hypothetical protein
MPSRLAILCIILQLTLSASAFAQSQSAVARPARTSSAYYVSERQTHRNSNRVKDERIDLCLQAIVTMPSMEHHVAWLAQNPRYGATVADKFKDRAGKSGNDRLQFQIYYHPELSASGWFDIENYSGIANSNPRVLKKWACGTSDRVYPLLFMIGIEPKFIRDGTLYVSKKKSVFPILSLGSLRGSEPIPMRLTGSKELVCRDVIAASFWEETRECTDIASHFTAK